MTTPLLLRSWHKNALLQLRPIDPILAQVVDSFEGGKSPRENEMGEKGLSCSDGFDYEPIFGKEAQQCVFLTTDGFANK